MADEKKEIPDNVIFVGGKEFMNYVMAVTMQFNIKNSSAVIIKSRGKFTAKAIDIAEVTAKRFLDNKVKISDVKIDSESFKNQEGREVRVSTIEIVLTKV